MTRRRFFQNRAGRFGFTLIELLVALGIIVLLIGILLPVPSASAAAGARCQRTAHDRNPQIGTRGIPRCVG